MTGRVVWLPPGTYSVKPEGASELVLEGHSSLEPHPDRTWTIQEILADLRASLNPTGRALNLSSRIYLMRVVGGHTAMAELAGCLYVSLIDGHLKPNIWDLTRAGQLGYVLTW